MSNDANSPILITGCARSGTSMTAGLINLAGAWGGEMSPPNRNNQRGMFENREVRSDMVKAFLRSIKCDPLGQHPLPSIGYLKSKFDGDFCDKWRNRFMRIMSKQGYDGGPLFYKGAKMCLMWPIWANAFPQARWVIVRRETEDIVNSCLRTSFMRAYKTRSGWLHWVAEHEARFEQMIDAGLDVREVWPQRMIAGDFTEMQMVVNNLGLVWDADGSREFVDPGLWRRWVSRRDRHGDN